MRMISPSPKLLVGYFVDEKNTGKMAKNNRINLFNDPHDDESHLKCSR